MTPAELYAAVLEKLEVTGQGQTATAADALIVQMKYEALYQLLSDENLVDWALVDDLPKWAENIIVCMVSAMLITQFGVDATRAAGLMGEGGWNLPQMSLAERQLRLHQHLPYISKPARPEYF